MLPQERRVATASLRALETLDAAEGSERKRVRAAPALRPFADCFELLDCGDGLEIFVANPIRVLLVAAARCHWYLEALRRWGPQISCALFVDETTGGNVLKVDQRLKVCLFYLGLRQQLREAPNRTSLFPVAACTHEQLKDGPHVLSLVLARLVRQWRAMGAWSAANVHGVEITLQLCAFVADHDGQRMAFMSKGSAAIKPCLFCANVVKKHCAATRVDDHFVDICEDDVARFMVTSSAEVFVAFDDLLPQASNASKARRAELEKCFGFHLDPRSLLADVVARAELPLEAVVNDSMHCYFSNGVASQEVNLLVTCLAEHLITPSLLRDAVAQTNWTRPKRLRDHGQTRYWTSSLFKDVLFQGDLYKGSAGDTVAICPLIYYYAKELAPTSLQPQLASFAALLDCMAALEACSRRAGTPETEALCAAQQKHMRLFKAAYSADLLRPKAHHRMHLPSHYRRHGYLTCWEQESAHRYYKHDLAEALQHLISQPEAFGKALLSRMLLRVVTELTGRVEPRTSALQPPVVDSDSVTALYDVPATLSETCLVAGLSLAKGDVILTPDLRSSTSLRSVTMLPYMLFSQHTSCPPLAPTAAPMNFLVRRRGA